VPDAPSGGTPVGLSPSTFRTNSGRASAAAAMTLSGRVVLTSPSSSISRARRRVIERTLHAIVFELML